MQRSNELTTGLSDNSVNSCSRKCRLKCKRAVRYRNYADGTLRCLASSFGGCDVDSNVLYFAESYYDIIYAD
ncbi:hypothetical protein BBBOND_0102500 [Babesia bigemina]|uniref:Uncharacterized protein n=1 Tax=Babesia bigemina TaxID=5866 RepID=A0A061CZ70_BABBI|nr:hypothetical protein BBBOND_0102500 [Babesia bigemina]CDR93921.1 hypothetical protein BBBOND_0102500 [Babesia bigemina]|eukprot:XP_012766107.1 hypothetical protein BBBOND_0102500 [Babesia bigemina]